ncbi:MAG TPA: pilus assembly protein N-terminal domain-containing protein [Terriglobia bacterium]|jgi:pilus assembly protein CpaC|nr:pilus assembly protein N-terminal domain-containing protein [Terriglobia bacterium]
MHLLAGQSLVIASATRIRRVSLADPGVIDALVMSPAQILVNGKAPGASSLVIWDEAGQSRTLDIIVDLDVAGINGRIRDVLPGENVDIQANKDVLIISGKVSSQAVADKVVQMAQAIAPKKENVVSLLDVPVIPGGQVLLQVKFADVDRSALTQLGANILSLPGAKNIGAISTGQFSPPQVAGQTVTGSSGGFTLSDLLNVFIFRPDIDLAATIQALQSKNLIEILAEPNVLSETGKEASFLAGGEFPYPVVQPSAGATAITIQFREFGVKLNFTPVITPDGFIHLKVRPEVSSLDYSNALTISGFTVPALDTRRVESEMVLKDGQSFAIAGLVNDQITETLSKIPGAASIPVLGKLFQSKSLTKSKDELLVMVTPRIVRPGAEGPAPRVPGFPQQVLPPASAPSPHASGGAH